MLDKLYAQVKNLIHRLQGIDEKLILQIYNITFLTNIFIFIIIVLLQTDLPLTLKGPVDLSAHISGLFFLKQGEFIYTDRWFEGFSWLGVRPVLTFIYWVIDTLFKADILTEFKIYLLGTVLALLSTYFYNPEIFFPWATNSFTNALFTGRMPALTSILFAIWSTIFLKKWISSKKNILLLSSLALALLSFFMHPSTGLLATFLYVIFFVDVLKKQNNKNKVLVLVPLILLLGVCIISFIRLDIIKKVAQELDATNYARFRLSDRILAIKTLNEFIVFPLQNYLSLGFNVTGVVVFAVRLYYFIILITVAFMLLNKRSSLFPLAIIAISYFYIFFSIIYLFSYITKESIILTFLTYIPIYYVFPVDTSNLLFPLLLLFSSSYDKKIFKFLIIALIPLLPLSFYHSILRFISLNTIPNINFSWTNPELAYDINKCGPYLYNKTVYITGIKPYKDADIYYGHNNTDPLVPYIMIKYYAKTPQGWMSELVPKDLKEKLIRLNKCVAHDNYECASNLLEKGAILITSKDFKNLCKYAVCEGNYLCFVEIN